jgi:plastocyanin
MTRSALFLTLATLSACGGGSSSSKMIGPCPADVNGCTAADYVDFSVTPGTAAEIDFGGGLGRVYSPRCAQVKVGQSITFVGDFFAHPLSQTCGPVNGIPHQGSGSSPLTFTLDTAGSYGYQCDNHHASGMVGAIKVVP